MGRVHCIVAAFPLLNILYSRLKKYPIPKKAKSKLRRENNKRIGLTKPGTLEIRTILRAHWPRCVKTAVSDSPHFDFLILPGRMIPWTRMYPESIYIDHEVDNSISLERLSAEAFGSGANRSQKSH